MRKCLLIGYGSEIRSDDILGQYIVENYDDTALDNKVILSRKIFPQLDIILAEDFLNYDTIIFIDARDDDDDTRVIVKKHEYISCGKSAAHTSHHVSIQDLMKFAQQLYGVKPPCYSILPKAYDFSVGSDLSEKAMFNAQLAYTEITKIIQS